MSIRTLFVVALCGALLLPFAVAVTGYLYAAGGTRTQAYEQLEAIAEKQESRLEDIVRGQLNRVDRITDRGSLRRAAHEFRREGSRETRAELEAVLDEIAAATPYALDLRLITVGGQIVRAPSASDDALSPSPEVLERTLAHRTFGIPHTTPNHGLLIAFASPVRSEGRYLGTLVVTAEARRIQTILEDYRGLGRSGETLLVDRRADGRLIRVSPSRLNPNAEPEIVVLDRPSEATSVRYGRPVREARDYRGVNVLLATRRIDPVGWDLIVKIDAEEALAALHRLRAISIVGFSLAFGLLLLVALRLSSTIRGHLEAIAASAKGLHHGEPKTKTRRTRITELASVGAALDSIAGDLLQAREERDASQAWAARAEREAQVREAQKMEALKRLAGGVAHDFNNLLTVILGYADALGRRLDPESVLVRYVGELRMAGERAARLTAQLLSFSQKDVLEPKLLDLCAVVGEMEGLLRRVAGDDVDLVIRVAEAPAPILADAGQLEQILLNLVVNSRDAMPAGGTLTVEVCLVTLDAIEKVRLLVADTGIGMDEVTREQAIEPFFTTKDESKGTGLGLAMVYGSVRQVGGDLRIESAVGRGTTVELLFPRAQNATTQAPRVSQVHERRGQETILVVEDEPAVMRWVKAILEGAGYRVLDARDGRQALDLARSYEGGIDLLLTDVVMPIMGGAALAQELKAERPALPVIYMSGFAKGDLVKERVAHKDADFLAKPVRAEVLLDKVDAVLRRTEADDPPTRDEHTA